ncbi:hypothetical protein COB47_1796 [Caldicellulosiruptor obsidiansis OB47]|uniref:Uncharacterized protein n=1 Tax=Caldicellulosiruptor obsidiansis (strain ATCC BAA-2073 / JCM 16842 / OB47) TaxID=608506 RepID=D9TFV2_CALOO|nr:hypothetical protein COB47_1796 [Caldicellulosiruptor obsidiansis OB47]
MEYLVNLLDLQSSLEIQKFRKYIELIRQRLEVSDDLVGSLETLVFDLLKNLVSLLDLFYQYSLLRKLERIQQRR